MFSSSMSSPLSDWLSPGRYLPSPPPSRALRRASQLPRLSFLTRRGDRRGDLQLPLKGEPWKGRNEIRGFLTALYISSFLISGAGMALLQVSDRVTCGCIMYTGCICICFCLKAYSVNKTKIMQILGVYVNILLNVEISHPHKVKRCRFWGFM